MQKSTFPAKLEHLEEMINFILGEARAFGFDDKKLNQIQLAAEEVLVNIIHYAYHHEGGKVEITLMPKEKEALGVEIADWGFPFNPLNLPEPNVAAPLEERQTGGLGIYLLRKIMDDVGYRREDGRNILSFIKKL